MSVGRRRPATISLFFFFLLLFHWHSRRTLLHYNSSLSPPLLPPPLVQVGTPHDSVKRCRNRRFLLDKAPLLKTLISHVSIFRRNTFAPRKIAQSPPFCTTTPPPHPSFPPSFRSSHTYLSLNQPLLPSNPAPTPTLLLRSQIGLILGIVRVNRRLGSPPPRTSVERVRHPQPIFPSSGQARMVALVGWYGVEGA